MKNDLVGMKFGRLTVIARDGYAPNGKGRESAWLCMCDCGRKKTIARSALRRGLTRSCGCLLAEFLNKPRRHGHARKGFWTPEYRTWTAMIRRCEHPSEDEVAIYGHVTVCERWRTSFEAFLADMGAKPSTSHSLDRIDGTKGYSPENCRWATPAQQVENRRNTIRDGGITLKELSLRTGLSYRTLLCRYRAGHRGAALVRPLNTCVKRHTKNQVHTSEAA